MSSTMESTALGLKDSNWWLFTLPALFGTKTIFSDPFVLLLSLFMAFITVTLLTWAFSPGGSAWKNNRNNKGLVPISGPRGLPLFGSIFSLSHGLPHRTLAAMMARTKSQTTRQLMALSVGSTPVVVSSDPQTAREILTSPHFADRPIKQSAESLMFHRAMGFAPNGTYWRLLRRIASSHLFAPKRILAHETGRQLDCAAMLRAVDEERQCCVRGTVVLRKHLQAAALNNIMGSVFGKRYDFSSCGSVSDEAKELQEMVSEGFELLGAFNWSDHLPWLSYVYDPLRIKQRCEALVPRVRKLVLSIIEEHRRRRLEKSSSDDRLIDDESDFVDVLLSLDGEEKLDENDMVSVLWEMIFRGTDATAILTEWVMAELVLNPSVQAKLQEELDSVVMADNNSYITDEVVANKMPYLGAVVKETLRVHPPGPLLSWARLSTSDVKLTNGMLIPVNTTAMVNMWAITHDPNVWAQPTLFKPERFFDGSSDGLNNNLVDVRGNDMRLAPFGAGRRVCPGKNLGLVTVNLWVAKLVHHFNWVEDPENKVDLTELMKLSCEMKTPLSALAVLRKVN